MAEFCKECSIKLLGRDNGDFANLSTQKDTDNKLYVVALCEGCGPCQVDHNGKCVSTNCSEKHGIKRTDFANIEKTEKDIKAVFEKSLSVMLKKNKERGDNWRAVGVLGAFLELRSMYFRLRNLLWTKDRIILHECNDEWKEAVRNSLEDLRNFTMLMELSLMEDNLYGEKYPED